jgi:hypothetical protein
VKECSPYAGMSPGALMTSAIGLCTGMHVATYLEKEDIEHGGLEITVNNKYDRDPPRTVQFVLDIHLKAELDEEQRRGLLEEANNYYVGNTMRGGLGNKRQPQDRVDKILTSNAIIVYEEIEMLRAISLCGVSELSWL